MSPDGTQQNLAFVASKIICGNCLNQLKQLMIDDCGVILSRLSLADDHSGVNARISGIPLLVPESKIVNHYCIPSLAADILASVSRMLMRARRRSRLILRCIHGLRAARCGIWTYLFPDRGT